MNLRSSKNVSVLMIGLLVSVFVFPRSFSSIKIVFVSLIISLLALKFYRAKLKISRELIKFYFCLALVGLIATLVGLLRGSSAEAIVDGARLYVGWSILIFFLLTYLRIFEAELTIHYSVIISALTISMINILLVITSVVGLTIYPEWLAREMLLEVGFHEGYVQIVSHNIGMLFFIVPYLITTILRKDGQPERRLLVWISLFLTIATAIISGRRGLWILIVMTPFMVFGMALITRTKEKVQAYKLMRNLLFALPSVLLILAIIINDHKTVEYIFSAFSPKNKRSMQKGYLIDGILTFPLIGSGFGGTVDYVRSMETPWVYELSYHQALYNFGILGFGIITFIILRSFYIFAEKLKYARTVDSGARLALIIGVVGVLVGAYGNPYLGSFDFLMVLGFLPLVASLRNLYYANK